VNGNGNNKINGGGVEGGGSGRRRDQIENLRFQKEIFKKVHPSIHFRISHKFTIVDNDEVRMKGFEAQENESSKEETTMMII
jgi:hypothetical protein